MKDFMHKTFHIYTPIIESDSAPHVLGPLTRITWEACHTTCVGWAQRGHSCNRVTGERMDGMEDGGNGALKKHTHL